MNYNFPNHIRGDTFDGLQFTLVNDDGPIDLTSCLIEVDFRVGSTTSAVIYSRSTADGITITDAVNGVFQINAFETETLAAGTYFYDMQFLFPDGRVKTYLSGTWTLTQDITQA